MTDQIKTTVQADFQANNLDKLINGFTQLINYSKAFDQNMSKQSKEIAAQFSSHLRALNGLKDGQKLTEKQTEALAKMREQMTEYMRLLKDESAVNKGIFSNKQAEAINKISDQITKLAKYYDNFQKQSQLGKGTFGLDSKNLSDAERAVKEITKAISAWQGQLLQNPGDKVLTKQLSLLQQNKVAVEDLVKSFKLEKDWSQALKMNALFDKNKLTKDWGDAIKENESRTSESLKRIKELQKQIMDGMNPTRSGRSIYKSLTNNIDMQPMGQAAWTNQASAYQLDIQRKANQNYVEAAKNLAALKERSDSANASITHLNAEMNRIGLRQTREGFTSTQDYFNRQVEAMKQRERQGLLDDIYRDHNLKGSTFAGYNVKDSDKVREKIKDIIALQQQLVSLRMAGVNNLDTERKILNEIASKTKLVDSQRQSDKANDPEHQKRQIANMLGRVTGDGGSALLQVQAMLSINYAILNTFKNAITGAVGSTIQFEAALKNMQAISGATTTEMLTLEGTIRKVSTNTKFSAVELSDAALILAQAGMSAKEIEKALPSVATLATATGSSLAQAVDIATSVVGVFDKSVNDIPDLANKISATMNMSKANAESLRLGLQYVGVTAKESGVSLEEVLATMGALSNAGIKSGSTLGTGMRQVMTELQKPSKEFIEALSRINLTFSDVDVKTVGWVGSLRKLRDAGFVASDAIKSFDVRGAASFNAALSNFKDVERILESYNTNGGAQQANDIQMDSLQSQLARLTNSMTNIVSTGLNPLGTGMKTVVSILADALNWLEPLSGAFKVLGTAIGIVALSVIPVWTANMLLAVPALKAFNESVKATFATLSLSSAFSAIQQELTLVRLGFAATAASSGVFAASLNTVSYALTALFNVVKAHPIMLLITAITAGVALLSSFKSETEQLTERIDKQTAALNDSKSASDRHSESLRKVEEASIRLAEKEDLLRAGKLNLKDAAVEVNSVIAEFGLRIDTTNPKLDDMENVLAKIRDRLYEIKKADLSEVAEKAESIAKDHTAKAEALSRDAAKSKFFGDNPVELFSKLMGSRGLQNLATNNGIDLDVLNRLNAHLRSGGLMSSFPELGQASNLLLKLRNKDGATNVINRENWDKLYSSISGVAEELKQAAVATGQSEAARREDKGLTAYQDYTKKNPVIVADINGNKQTLNIDELTARAAAVVTRAENTVRDSGKNPVQNPDLVMKTAQELASELVSASRDAMDQLEAKYASGNLPQDTYNRVRGSLVGVRSTASGKISEYAKQYDNRLEFSYDRDMYDATAEQKLILKQAQFSPSSLKGKEQRLYDLLEKQRQLDETKAVRGLTPNTDDYDRTVQKNTQKYLDLKLGLDEQIYQIHKRHSEATQHSYADAAAKMAEYYKTSAEVRLKQLSPYSTLEDIMKAIDDGLIDMQKSGEKELDKLKAERSKKKREGASDQYLDLLEQAQQQKNEENKKAFREKGMNVYEAASFQQFSHKKEFDFLVANMDALRHNIELTEFNRQQPIQEVDKQLAGYQGKYNQSTSTAQIENLQFQRDQMEKKALETKAQQLEPLIAEAHKGSEEAIEALGRVEERIALRKLAGAKEDEIAQLEKARTFVQEKFATFAKEELSAKKEVYDTELKIKQLQVVQGKSADLDVLKTNLDEAWDDYKRTVDQMDVNKTISDGMLSVARNSTSQLGTALADIATRSKTAGEAFRGMATTIVKSMLDILAQAAAMQMIKGLFSLFGINTGSSYTPATTSGGTPLVGSFDTAPMAAVGGQAVPGGFVYSSTPIQRFAWGGPVTGGRAGKDSVPALLMPGEFVIKKRVVDALGTSFFHGLNNDTQSVVQSSQSAMAMGPKHQGADGTVNVWIITPDQKPGSMGPKDIVAVVSDDISRGGSIKKLIKQVQIGNM